ncbi:MAG TPA: class I SAM-dependent methyltransferase, partial [Pyrinomonadaceae bacterium]|nr:class I SAM-dependent methyltransferase [Pyrinomonadaceae bacterium]
MAFFSSKTGQFTYFSLQLGEKDWCSKNVLDFGGNIGNMLRDPNCTIDPERYWCLDVVAQSIEKGKEMFPHSHWIFYDRYCFFFNPRGVELLKLPPLEAKFDYIVAYSVFTNTSRTDMLDLVSQLESKLADGGALAFTFIDPHFHSWPGRYHENNLVWRLEREIYLEGEKGNTLDIDVSALAGEAKDAQWFVLVNGEDLYLETEKTRHYAPEEQRTYHMFYTVDYMKSLFPQATILPPVNDEMQHCCVIRNQEKRTSQEEGLAPA